MYNYRARKMIAKAKDAQIRRAYKGSLKSLYNAQYGKSAHGEPWHYDYSERDIDFVSKFPSIMDIETDSIRIKTRWQTFKEFWRSFFESMW